MSSPPAAKSPAPSDRVLAHTSTTPIRWADMDMLGHVNNTVYFRYMEQARIEWLAAVSTGGSGFHQGHGPVIVNANCEFMVPLVYPGTVEVRMFLGDLGRTSMGSYYEIFMEGRIYATGAARLVWIDLATGRPIPLPEQITTILRELRA